MISGERIKVARLARGLTQQQLADKIGVQRAAISKYEKNIVEISAKQLSKIAKALCVVSMIFDDEIVDNDDFNVFTIDEISYKLNNLNLEYFGASHNQMEEEYLIKVDLDKAIILLNINGKKEALKYVNYLATQTEYTTPDEE